jgi:hypothetical protein
MTLVPLLQFILAIDDNDIAGLETSTDADCGAGGLRYGAVVNFDGVVVSYDVDVSTIGATLKCSKWNQAEVALGIHEQVRVNELIGKEAAVSLLKTAFSL